MKIYEITTRTPNEQLINRELIKLYEAAATPPAASVTSSIGGFFSASGKILMNLLKGVGLYYLLKPIYVYYKNMSAAEENLKLAHNSADARAKYNEEHNIQTGLLIESFVAALLTKAILGSVTGLVNFLRIIPGIGPIIVKIISALSQGAQIYLLEKISSIEGRTMLAQWLTFTLLNGDEINGVKAIGALGNKAFDSFASMINDAISADSTTPAEKPAEQPAAQPTQTQALAQTSQDTATQTEKPAEQPAAQPAQTQAPASPADANQFTPARFKRNKFGELVLKYADSD